MGSLCGGGSNTTTTNQTYTPNAQAMAQYQQILERAQGVASTPYQSYGGELTAGVNTQQQTGIGNINSNANFAVPYIGEAAEYARMSGNPMTGADVSRYMDPYQQQVVDATQAQFDRSNATQQSQLTGNAAAQGALGGDRVGVAQAELAGNQKRTQDPTIAGIYSNGFNNAVQAWQRQQQAAGSAAGTLGNLGIGGQSAALHGAGAQIGAGTLQQTTDQARNNALYGQYMQAQAFPYQQTGWLAGIGTGLGSQMGGTTQGTSTAPPPNQMGQIIGAGVTAASMFMSDRRLKEGVREIGATFDGQPIYRYSYRNDPATRIGLMAQDVEQVHPEAVGEVGGYKAVDYDAATEDSARIPRRAQGGIATPYGGGPSFIPEFPLAPGRSGASGGGGPAQAKGGQSGAQQMASSAVDLAKIMRGGIGSGSPMNLTNGLDPSAVGTINPSVAAMPGIGGLYAHGGMVMPNDLNGIYVPRGYDDGGGVPWNMDDRWAGISGEGTGADRGMVPLPRPRPESAPDLIGDSEETPGIGFSPTPTRPSFPPYNPSAPPTNVPDRVPTAASSTSYEPSGRSSEGSGGILSGLFPGFGKLSPEAQQGLMAAGLGMMASRSPHALTQIGEGGLTGMKTYSDARTKTMTAEKQARELSLHLAQLSETTRHHKSTEGLSREQLSRQNQLAELQGMQPVKIGQDFMGRDLFAIRDKSGSMRIIDPNTGTILAPGQSPGSLLNPGGGGSSAAPAPAVGGGLPPTARSQLREGVITTFGNGQKWTLLNGQPSQVQ